MHAHTSNIQNVQHKSVQLWSSRVAFLHLFHLPVATHPIQINLQSLKELDKDPDHFKQARCSREIKENMLNNGPRGLELLTPVV